MTLAIATSGFLLILAGCGSRAGSFPTIWPASADGPARGTPTSLVEARRAFRTKLAGKSMPADPLPQPPPELFGLVRYVSPAGKLAAYLSPDPGNGRKNPAIVWITGGDCNSIGEPWEEKPKANDQTAAAYRKAGIVMMFPSLRGGNDNPGRRESFLGEVDDVLAAADYLSKLDYVDPARIYLGGHSTGGTLAMLVAESSDRFRAVFSFGPADDVRGYGPNALQFDFDDASGAEIRSPGRWLDSVSSPLFVFEGTKPSGNIDALRRMEGASKNPMVHFTAVIGADHFNILAATNELMAAKILRDQGPSTNIAFTNLELVAPRR